MAKPTASRPKAKRLQPRPRRMRSLHSMPSSKAEEANTHKAVECLIKDRHLLLTFYDFPAEHRKYLRTTNVIESSFATLRHRIDRTLRTLLTPAARLDKTPSARPVRLRTECGERILLSLGHPDLLQPLGFGRACRWLCHGFRRAC